MLHSNPQEVWKLAEGFEESWDWFV